MKIKTDVNKDNIYKNIKEFLEQNNLCISRDFIFTKQIKIENNIKNKPISEYCINELIETKEKDIKYNKYYFDLISFLLQKNESELKYFITNKIPKTNEYYDNRNHIAEYLIILKDKPKIILDVLKTNLLENYLNNNIITDIIFTFKEKDDQIKIIEKICNTKGFVKNISKQKEIFDICKNLAIEELLINKFNLINTYNHKKVLNHNKHEVLYSTFSMIDINSLFISIKKDHTWNKDDLKIAIKSTINNIPKLFPELDVKKVSMDSNDEMEISVIMAKNETKKIYYFLEELTQSLINLENINLDKKFIIDINQEFIAEKSRIMFIKDELDNDLIKGVKKQTIKNKI